MSNPANQPPDEMPGQPPKISAEEREQILLDIMKSLVEPRAGIFQAFLELHPNWHQKFGDWPRPDKFVSTLNGLGEKGQDRLCDDFIRFYLPSFIDRENVALARNMLSPEMRAVHSMPLEAFLHINDLKDLVLYNASMSAAEDLQSYRQQLRTHENPTQTLAHCAELHRDVAALFDLCTRELHADDKTRLTTLAESTYHTVADDILGRENDLVIIRQSTDILVKTHAIYFTLRESEHPVPQPVQEAIQRLHKKFPELATPRYGFPDVMSERLMDVVYESTGPKGRYSISLSELAESSGDPIAHATIAALEMGGPPGADPRESDAYLLWHLIARATYDEDSMRTLCSLLSALHTPPHQVQDVQHGGRGPENRDPDRNR